jgi:hypothetical protein
MKTPRECLDQLEKEYRGKASPDRMDEQIIELRRLLMEQEMRLERGRALVKELLERLK